MALEIAYYLGYKQSTAQNSTQNTIKPSTTTPSPSPNPNNPSEIDEYYLTINKDLAIDPKVIDSLLFYKKGILQESTITNKHVGKVALVAQDGGKAYYDYYNFKLKLILLNENDPKVVHGFYFSADDLKNATIQTLENGKLTPITIYDLKDGDNLEIEHTIDAIKSTPYTNPTGKYTYKTKSLGFNTISLKITKVLP